MMRSNFWFILITLLFINNSQFAQGSLCFLQGTVKSEDGETLSDCNISVLDNFQGTVSDENGFYKLGLKPGIHQIRFAFVGFETQIKKITIQNGQKIFQMNIFMKEISITQKEVTVTGEFEELTISAQKLESIDIQNMPTIYSDVLRTIKILPGVTSNNELSSSYNVRGGNFDENLIYLNGYEIQRPFLLRKGVEENQSLVNPDMVEDLRFFGGGFPARFGDKMSSALEVNYKKGSGDVLAGVVRADMLNSGISLRNKIGNLSWTAGARYAYPGVFLKGLQTKGSFSPEFLDVQLLLNYQISDRSEIELFLLNANNKFDLTPKDWKGNYRGIGRGDYGEIQIKYDGERNYDYSTSMAGLKFKTDLSAKTSFTFSAAGYKTEENENVNLLGYIYSSESYLFSNDQSDFVKTRHEVTDNSIKLETFDIKPELKFQFKDHTIYTGLSYKYSSLKNRTDEKLWEVGDSLVLEEPLTNFNKQNYILKTFSGYVQDLIIVNEKLQVNAGVRFSKYSYNKEFIVSPRFSIHYFMSPVTILRFSTGYYVQQPFYYELLNYSAEKKLKSQKSLHFILGWEQKFENNLELNAEVYYKKLDDLIPYYINEVKLNYIGGNSLEGYSRGLDLLLKGEVIKGTRNWIGYSYLDSGEREKGSGGDYDRRILDQTHTLQIFIQDKGKKSRNLQSHLRILMGSGFLFHPRTIETNPETGEEALTVDLNSTKEFSRFLRADMGLTWRTKFENGWKLVVVAEVLNVFNNLNALSYSFYHLMPGSKIPFKVPNLLSRRSFNVGVKLDF